MPLLKQFALTLFFIMAFGLFWLATPLTSSSFALVGLVASFAPTLAAILVTGLTEGKLGVAALFQRISIWRVGANWYLAALGIPLAVSVMINRSSGWFGSPGRIEPGVLTLFPIIFIFAAGEELGWRGFALPKLLGRFQALPVALGLGVVHALYHLPLWLAPGSPKPSYSFSAFLLTSLAFGILWIWLYLNTRGSVMISTVFHGTINTASNLLFGGIDPMLLSWLMPTGFIIVTIVVLLVYGSKLTPR